MGLIGPINILIIMITASFLYTFNDHILRHRIQMILQSSHNGSELYYI